MRPATVVGTAASLVLGIVIGVIAHRFVGSDEGRDERLLISAYREVRDGYVEEMPRGELLDSAIRGMIGRLDDRSAFLEARDLEAYKARARGHFGGIGVELGLRDGYVTVVAPLAGTPAATAGLVAGDRVIEVDHESLKGRTLRDAVSRLRGEPGTDVHLRVYRPERDEGVDYNLTRAAIATPAVVGRLLAPGYGYLRIAQFNDTTGEDLAAALDDLQGGAEPGAEGAPSESGPPLKGLVLDVRNNPGGLLNAAVAVAETFLDGGLIFYTDGRSEAVAARYEAAPGDALGGAPIALLVNGGAASASEVVAGALQDRGRGTVFGERSYGKGSVQTVVTFQQRRGIKITTARYHLPSGASIDAKGIEPDVYLPPGEDEARVDYDERLLAAALAWLRRDARDLAAAESGREESERETADASVGGIAGEGW